MLRAASSPRYGVAPPESALLAAPGIFDWAYNPPTSSRTAPHGSNGIVSRRFPEEKNMPPDLNGHPAHEHASEPHAHACGNLFGCGEEKGTGVFREDIKDAAFTHRCEDRLLHMDEMNQPLLDGYMTARGRSRRRLLRASTFMGALAAVGPWFTKIAQAADALGAAEGAGSAPAQKKKEDEGRVHVVESNDQTVRLGVYDTTLAPIVKID